MGFSTPFSHAQTKVRFPSGLAVTAGEYSAQRNADGTNQFQFEVPTGAGFEFSINDVAQWTLNSSGDLNNDSDSQLNINGGFFVFDERADPSAPATNSATLYSKDNGAGKTQIVARFPTGAVQVIATEP